VGVRTVQLELSDRDIRKFYGESLQGQQGDPSRRMNDRGFSSVSCP
jgi:hypothetical protein